MGRGFAVGRSLFASLVAVGCLACAGSSGPPRWIENPAKAYSPRQYVTGVGQGADPEAAADAARAEVARQTKGETESVEITKTYVEIPKQRSKSKKGSSQSAAERHWALAVLDRPALAKRLTDRIQAGDEELGRKAALIASAPPDQAIGSILTALAVVSERDALRVRILNLGEEAPAPATTPSREDLERALVDVKHKLVVEVEANEMDPATGEPGAPIDAIRRALSHEVLEKGFALAATSGWGDTPSWLVVRARVGFDRLELGGTQGFAAVEWDAALEIEDKAGGAGVLGVMSHKERATHINEPTARRLARDEASAFLSEALATWLDDHYAPRATTAKR